MGTITCSITGRDPIRTPLRVQWVEFADLELKAIRADRAGYSLSRQAERMTGDYILAEARSA